MSFCFWKFSRQNFPIRHLSISTHVCRYTEYIVVKAISNNAIWISGYTWSPSVSCPYTSFASDLKGIKRESIPPRNQFSSSINPSEKTSSTTTKHLSLSTSLQYSNQLSSLFDFHLQINQNAVHRFLRLGLRCLHGLGFCRPSRQLRPPEWHHTPQLCRLSLDLPSAQDSSWPHPRPYPASPWHQRLCRHWWHWPSVYVMTSPSTFNFQKVSLANILL